MNSLPTKSLTAILLLPLISSCATPTPYAPVTQDNPLGYRITPTQDSGCYRSVFSGNMYTKKTDGFDYAALAAYDTCAEKGKIALVLPPKDKSELVSYIETTIHEETVQDLQDPMKSTTVQVSESHPATSEIPIFNSQFCCLDRILALGGINETLDLDPKAVHPPMADGKGAPRIRTLRAVGSSKSPFQVGDIVVSLGDTRTETSWGLFRAALGSQPGTVKLRVIRDGKLITVEGKISDTTEKVKAASGRATHRMCTTHEFKGNSPRVCVSTAGK